MDRLGLLRSRGPAGADRPDRLVGEDGIAERPDARPGDHRIELARDHALGRAAVALGERLADAQDRHEARTPAPRRTCARPDRPTRRGTGAARNGRPARSVQPMSLSIAADTSPVYAPCACSLTSCAPNERPLPRCAWMSAATYGNGGSTATSRRRRQLRDDVGDERVGRSRAMPCIFQFPATSGRRIASSRGRKGAQG